VAGGEVVGGELGSDPAPAERQARAEHCHLRVGAPERAQQVGQQARQRQADEHQRDRQVLRGVRGAARGGEQAGAHDADHDRRHRHVLVAARVLAQHPLGQEQQHQQARRERRLHDHQRGEQQREHLQGKAEDRQAGAHQPARAAHQAPHERDAQMLVAGRLLGVHRLQRDP